jgi:hypothetical protein
MAGAALAPNKVVEPLTPAVGSDRRKYWVVGGVVAALVLAGVALGISLPLTLNDDDAKPSTSASTNINDAPRSGSAPANSSQIISASTLPVTGRVREYFIAAEYRGWSYSSLYKNNCSGKPYSSDTSAALGPETMYNKAFFRQYTDSTFEVSKM